MMYAGAGPSAVNFFLLSYATRCAASLGASARYALPARRIPADSAAPTSLRVAVSRCSVVAPARSLASRNVGPSITAAYLPLQPLASSTLQFLILGAPVRAGSVAGATLALSGVYLVMRGKRIAEKAAEASAARTQGSKRLGVPSRV